MEMHAPFAITAMPGLRCAGSVDVDVAAQRACPAFDDLVQVHRLVEALQAHYGVRRHAWDAQSRRHLHLRDRDAGAGKGIEAIGRILEFDRGVAQVETYAEMST